MNIKTAIFNTIGTVLCETIHVPEFGVGLELNVGVMTVAERDAFDNAYRDIEEAKRAANFRPLLMVFTVKDQNYKPVFSVEDVEQIKQLNSLAVVRLTDAALRINKMLKTDVEQHEKNS